MHGRRSVRALGLALICCVITEACSGSASPAAAPVAPAGVAGAALPAAGHVAEPSENPQPIVIPVAQAGAAAVSGGAGAPEECGSIEQMAERKLGAVDIVWIVDGSPSMLDEIASIQSNLANFAQMIGKAGIDHHVIMLAPVDVADQTPLSTDAAHYKFVPAAVDSHNALTLLLDQYADYQPFLRADASLHFIVVSDDESFVPAETFKSQMEEKAGKKFHFHAIASESVDGFACVGSCGIPIVCGGSAPGTQYYALADATGGQKISICVSDWSMVFGPLQSAVIASAPLPCDYTLPAPPRGETLDTNKVNLKFRAPSASDQTLPRAATVQACDKQLAWYYDDPATPKQIRMCPAACDAISGGGTVRISLGCATVSLN
jgi:hypothetical protein